jgi:hypothetical protein
MHRRLMALGIVLALIIFSGCISVDVSQKVERDGSSFIIQRVDLGGLEGIAGFGATSPAPEICAKISQSDTAVGCVYDDDVITLNKTVKPSDGVYLFNRTSEFPYSIYTVEVRKAPAVISAGTASQAGLGSEAKDATDFKDPSSKPTAAMLRAAGIRFMYMIDMPGELLSAENGEIVVDESGKRYARYDIIKLMSDGEYMVVRSKELDLPMVGLAVIAAALLLGGIVVGLVILKARKKEPPKRRYGR